MSRLCILGEAKYTWECPRDRGEDEPLPASLSRSFLLDHVKLLLHAGFLPHITGLWSRVRCLASSWLSFPVTRMGQYHSGLAVLWGKVE